MASDLNEAERVLEGWEVLNGHPPLRGGLESDPLQRPRIRRPHRAVTSWARPPVLPLRASPSIAFSSSAA